MAVNLKNRKTYHLQRRKREGRLNRPKTFKTEEAAHAYAKEMGYTSYELYNKRVTDDKKKLVVVPKDTE